MDDGRGAEQLQHLGRRVVARGATTETDGRQRRRRERANDRRAACVSYLMIGAVRARIVDGSRAVDVERVREAHDARGLAPSVEARRFAGHKLGVKLEALPIVGHQRARGAVEPREPPRRRIGSRRGHHRGLRRRQIRVGRRRRLEDVADGASGPHYPTNPSAQTSPAERGVRGRAAVARREAARPDERGSRDVAPPRHDVEPRPPLRQQRERVDDAVLRTVPDQRQRFGDDAAREAVEALDVFQNCEARLLHLEDPYHLEEQTVLAEARAVARDGEPLAGKPCRQDVVVGHVVGVDLRDVAVRHVAEVRRVGGARVRVDF